MRNLLRVDSLKEAVRKDGLFLAGGTEILRLNTGVDENADLIDILPLLDKEIREEGDDVIIGSGVTFSDLLSSDIVPEYVKKAALYMCSAELRNQATIGGNLASWRDDSYLIPSLAAASARLLVLEKDGKLKNLGIEEYANCHSLIISITLNRKESVSSFRESLTSHSHAAITAAFGTNECYALKGSGIFFSFDSLKFVSDLSGSASYKSYLASLFRKESGRV